VETKWRNLGIIVVAVVVIAAVYLVFFSGLVSPTDQVPELQKSWKQEGLDLEYLHEDPEKVFSMEKEDLLKISENVSGFLSSSDDKTKSLAKIYSNYITFMIKMKEVDEISLALDQSQKSFCEETQTYESMISLREEAHQNLEEMNDNILEFNKKYSEESLDIALFTSEDVELQDAENLQRFKEEVAGFTAICN